MQFFAAAWLRFRALCAFLVVALSLAMAPALEAVKHGPASIAAEADHRAWLAEQGPSHGMPQGHHDSSDHEHVTAAPLDAPDVSFAVTPERPLRPDTFAAVSTTREGPRRPPRLTVI